MMKLKQNKLNKSFLGGLALAVCTLSPAAYAELEEIIVTAQKKSENLQTVPIAITAFTSAALDKSGIFNIEEIAAFTPGLTIGRNFNATSIYMRGVGAQAVSSPGMEGSVSVYVDGIYYSNGGDMVDGFNNIERVEVLKGPQGTLFGRNTTGGVVHTITKDPTHETQLKVRTRVGSENLYGGDIYASTGLSENVAADIAVAFQRMDGGYGTNLYNGKDAGQEEHTNFRSKLVWTPSDDTTVKLSATVGNYQNSGAKLNCSKTATFGCAAGTAPAKNFQDVNYEFETGLDNDRWIVSAEIDHAFSAFDFVSITALKEYDGLLNTDQDNTPLPLVNAPSNQVAETFSQEFQFHSNKDDSRFNWTAGLFYWDDESSYDVLDIIGLAIAPGIIRIDDTLATKSTAVFYQGDYDITDATKITAGLRWTNDKRHIYGTTDFGGAGVNVASFSEKENFEELTWKISIDHQLTEDVLIYLSHNRGFKSGFYNTGVASGVVAPLIEPETLDAYEIGLKGDFLDNRLRLNVAIFKYDYKDIQLSSLDAGVRRLANAGVGDIQGFEVEGKAWVSDAFSFNFGLAYLDATYDEFEGCDVWTPSPTALGPLGAGNLVSIDDCSGNDMIRSPELTYNLGLNYEEVVEAGTIGGSISLAYTDEFFWEPDNRFKQDAYTLVNAEISWTSNDEKYKVRFYGRNLSDEEYSIMGIEQAFGDAQTAALPRNFGASFEVSFY